MKFNYLKLTLFIATISIFVSTHTFGQSVIKLSEIDQYKNIESHFVFGEVTKTVDHFEPLLSSNPFLQTIAFKDHQWYGFEARIINDSNSAFEGFIGWNEFDSLIIKIEYQDTTISTLSGKVVPKAQKKINIAGLSWGKINLKKGETATIRLYGKYNQFIDYKFSPTPITIYQKTYLTETHFAMINFNWLYIGVLVVMACYNLFIYFNIKESSYLFYVTLNISGLFYGLFLSGFGTEFFLQTPDKVDFIHYGLGSTTLLTYILFIRSFLHLKKGLKWVDLTLKSIIIGLGVMFCLLLISNQMFVIVHIGMIIYFLSITLILYAAYWTYKTQNNRPALILLIGEIVYAIGIFISILFLSGILPPLALPAQMAISTQVGIMLELVILSLAMGARINNMKKEITERRLEKILLEKEQQTKLNEITEKKNQELEERVMQRTAELEEMGRTKDKLLSILSHDMKGPLNSLNGTLNLLSMDLISNEEFNNMAKILQNDLNNTNTFLQNMLQWAKLQMNQMEPTFKPVNMHQLGDSVIKLLAPAIRKKEIEMVNNFSNLEVNVDQEMIHFILRNLISNAVKFTREKGTITLYDKVENDTYFFTIFDNGVGFKKDTLDTIFKTNIITSLGTHSEKGTGLGLWMCYEFLMVHKGKVEVESKPNEGSKIHMQIPMGL